MVRWLYKREEEGEYDLFIIQIQMEGKYTFKQFEKELNEGYELYYTYVRNRYLLFKTAENCYTQKLLSLHDKNPLPVMSMLTKKRIKEMFPFMEEIEYKARKD